MLNSAVTFDLVKSQLLKLRFEQTARTLEEMVDQFKAGHLNPLEIIYSVCDRELTAKTAKRFELGIKLARFPRVCTLEDYDFGEQPSLNLGLIRELATLDWLNEAKNLLFQGPPGVGKTHLAIAFGRLAVAKGYQVLFYNTLELMRQLENAAQKGRADHKLRELVRPKLLIIDEVGYFPVSKIATHLFFQLIAGRYERSSIILTSNRKLREWANIFEDPYAVNAFLDRFLHHSEVITIKGDSHRLREKEKQDAIRDLRTTEIT